MHSDLKSHMRQRRDQRKKGTKEERCEIKHFREWLDFRLPSIEHLIGRIELEILVFWYNLLFHVVGPEVRKSHDDMCLWELYFFGLKS